MTVNTVFYAIWEKHENPVYSNQYMPGSHKYSVKESKSVVTIKCSCGLEIKNRTMSRSEFMYYCFNQKTEFNSLNNWNRKQYERKLILYKAQDAGPLALKFSTSFYKDPKKQEQAIEDLFATLDEMAGTIDDVDDYRSGKESPVQLIHAVPSDHELRVLDANVVQEFEHRIHLFRQTICFTTQIIALSESE